MSSTSSMQNVYPLLYEKKQYQSVAVKRAQMMFFDECVTHYGPKNDTDQPRRVLFVQLVDKTKHGTAADRKIADNYQFYEWQYVSQYRMLSTQCLTMSD
jgi:hypothetical protein